MTNKCSVIVWGTGGHAKVVSDILSGNDFYHISAYIDNVNRERKTFLGKPVFNDVSEFFRFDKEKYSFAHVAIGNCAARLKISSMLTSEGFSLVPVYHPKSTVSGTAAFGSGCMIAPGVIVGCHSRLGSSVILNTASTVDHDCIIEDGVHISPGVHLAGNVKVKRGAWIGIGSVVAENISIGEGSIVGAGAVVLADVPDSTLVVGVPAKIVRQLG